VDQQKLTQGRRGKYTAEEKAAIEAEKEEKRRQREIKRRKQPGNCRKVEILYFFCNFPTLMRVFFYSSLSWKLTALWLKFKHSRLFSMPLQSMKSDMR
jgi:hypothetical protein